MNTITRKFGNTSISVKTADSRYDKDVLIYALSAYSFVLPFNCQNVKFSEWIETIKKCIDCTEIHNAEVVRVLGKYA